ncbi:MAG: type I 3-dehydroquinate dehydratase [Methanomicrobiaceae archaeon]|nr:type I 3-dehydroquinate dehydratase [Methanomicrobiaceae archaeon]
MKPKFIISVSSVEDFRVATEYNPDLIEIRIDLSGEGEEALFDSCSNYNSIPMIGTIRSNCEGGRFDGSPEEWYEMIKPWIPLCNYIDMERPFSGFSSDIRSLGKKVISSVHLDYMPGETELQSIEEELRKTGDIPKIIVTPDNHEDVLLLSRFTLNSPKPLITGVMGNNYRWARALCCLFGSYAVFCHTGSPSSEGQYHIDEMRQLISLLNNNHDNLLQ